MFLYSRAKSALDMTPGLRDMLEDSGRINSVPPEAILPILGELVVLLARLLLQASIMPAMAQTENPEDLDRLLTVRETATLLSLRPAHVYDLVRQRTLPALRVGKYVRVRPRDLHAWIEGQREKGVDANIYPSLKSPLPMSRPNTKVRSKKSR